MAEEIEDPEMAKSKSTKKENADPAEGQAQQDPPQDPPAPAADDAQQDPPQDPPAPAAPRVQAAPPPPPPEPPKQKSVEQLAVERLRRNGYSEDAIDEAMETYGPRAILNRTHRLECGDVGETGEHGDLGDDALKP